MVEAVTNFDAWTASVGSLSVSSGELTVSSLSSGEAVATTGDAWLRDGYYTVKVKFSTANGEAGIRIGGTLLQGQYHAVVDAADGKIELLKGNPVGSPIVLASANMTVNTGTWYTILNRDIGTKGRRDEGGVRRGRRGAQKNVNKSRNQERQKRRWENRQNPGIEGRAAAELSHDVRAR